MLSAPPYVHLPQPRTETDVARDRLRGTVWERLPTAQTLYVGCLFAGRWLGRHGVTANALTYASLVLAIAAGAAAATGQLALAGVLVLASGLCDMLDGVVARATGTQSAYGALLDSTVDRLTDGLPLLGLVVAYGPDGALAAIPGLAMLGGFAVSYVRARAESLGAKLPGLFMRRPERVALLTASLLLAEVLPHGVVFAPLLLLGISLMAVLNVVAMAAALRAAKLALVTTRSTALRSVPDLPTGDIPSS
ncbi:MAG TPA: CDP-alcohol phosphatidyltransferase family protein [Polyangiaceae bacterium]|nr:CDP-alcohol phosphatidyltransferase family protein [Polyangiaceae bacterium]